MIFLERIHRVLDRISLWAVWAGGFALMLAAFMIVIEVVGRKIGGTEFLGIAMPSFRVPGSDEYSAYIFAGATTWAYAYALIHRGHIRIDALYNLMPARVRAVLDVIALALLGWYMYFITERSWDLYLKTLKKGSKAATPQQTPLWLPQGVWVTGLTFFTIVTIFLFIYTLVCLIRGNTAKVQALAGTMSVAEEVEEETRGMKEIDR
ncbi:MAG: TRAP transporter small permease [Pseudomonadota bacterium]